jgi:hypothetical protein
MLLFGSQQKKRIAILSRVGVLRAQERHELGFVDHKGAFRASQLYAHHGRIGWIIRVAG